MGLIKKTNEAADRLCQILLVALFTLIIVSSFLQVFSRFVLGKAFVWTDELSRYGLVWLTFVAAGLGFRRKSHVAIDVVIGLFPEKQKQAAAGVQSVLVAAMALFLLVKGVQLAGMTMGQDSPAMGIPMGIVYAAIPFFSLLTLLFSLEDLCGRLVPQKDCERKEGSL